MYVIVLKHNQLFESIFITITWYFSDVAETSYEIQAFSFNIIFIIPGSNNSHLYKWYLEQLGRK